jgi:hypothetical protein
MACDPATLISQSSCFDCLVSTGLAPYVEIVLLCAIRDGTVISTDPQALITQASCLLGCIPPGALAAVKLAILCDILTP